MEGLYIQINHTGKNVISLTSGTIFFTQEHKKVNATMDERKRENKDIINT